MKKLLIHNYCNWHYEIIESVIIKYNELIDIPQDEQIKIYLFVNENESFKNYIKNKYPNIVFDNILDYDYFINCTIYDFHYDELNQNINSKEKYIAHEITDRLKSNPNVYFLTCLSKKNIFTANILPYTDVKIKTRIPIYLIQGSIRRRDINLLKAIFETPLFYNFKIKLLGRDKLPKELNKYKKRFIIKSNLQFEDYHKELSNIYCILPLISKEKQPQYYTNKLTSSINYALGYNLKCIIDNDLQNIYHLNNAYIYSDKNNICEIFKQSLKDFYNKTNLDKKIKYLQKINSEIINDINKLKKINNRINKDNFKNKNNLINRKKNIKQRIDTNKLIIKKIVNKNKFIIN